ncbi:GNAT family N-acetyltransferase [Altererythrobacter sp. MTPC7]|uniref:GNAT family N-acetyltransferase n=1 Tax=Altererythrobacter sp. MTPC7 TaxID=3056567 RepID=UPI0036F2A08E
MNDLSGQDPDGPLQEAAGEPLDPLAAIMLVMEASFDPRWGEAWNERQVASSLAMPSTRYVLVAADGSEPQSPQETAGFAMTRAAPGEEELLLIAVRPEHRRSGLGAHLLDILSGSARERGVERIFLEMRENNPAVSLYDAAGFAPIGRRKAYYKLSDGSRLDAITFARTL